MTAERKSAELQSRLSVKRGGKIMSKSSKSASTSILSPSKATIAAPKPKKDEVHRRKNPFNDMLRRGGSHTTDRGKGGISAVQDPELGDNASLVSSHASQDDIHARLCDQITELERDLAISKTGRESLKEELENAEAQRQTDKQTIGDLRQRLTGAQTQVHRTVAISSGDHERNGQSGLSSDQSRDDLIQYNYELQTRLIQLQEQLAAQDAHRGRVQQETQREERELVELRARLQASERESHERLQQLLSLKSSISSLTRVDEQITDSELVEAFSQLANRIREWVVVHFRRSKLELDKASPDIMAIVRSLTSRLGSTQGTDRLAFYQAIVSSTLMRVFQEPVLIGMSAKGPLTAVTQCAEIVRGDATHYHQWRRMTIRAIEGSQVASHVFQESQRNDLRQLALDIGEVLHTITSVGLNHAAQSTLTGILDTAAGLQRTLILQKAQYRVLFYEAGVNFEHQRMESINDLDGMVDDDGDTLTEERRFLFCVFPCLEKSGDEWGEHLDKINVLMKARVCCGVG